MSEYSLTNRRGGDAALTLLSSVPGAPDNLGSGPFGGAIDLR